MRKAVIVVGILLGVWLIGEVAVASVAEGQIESRVEASTEGATRVSADLQSFPTVARLLTTGKISKITVRFDEIARRRLEFADFSITMEGVSVDRGSIFSGDPEIRSIESGRVEAFIRSSFLSGALGFASRLLGELPIEVRDRQLFIGGPLGASAPIPLPGDLFPCDPDAELRDDGVLLSCTIDEVPEQLIKAANEAS